MASMSEVGRYRSGMADLLGNLVAVSGHTEQWLDVAMDGKEDWTRVSLEDDPTGAFRIGCALLLRKARLHMIAMLRANENSNLHSLGVQIRPILECAGQVVLVFHNLMIEPGRGASVVGGYLNADFYRTFIGLTKGELGHGQLLKMISTASGVSEEEAPKGRSLKQADKVARLRGEKTGTDT